MAAFDPARRGLTLAGMLRFATRQAATNAGWSEAALKQRVLGHGDGDGPRLMYVPVPTIEFRHGAPRASAIRRCLLLAVNGSTDEDARWIRRALAGAELIREQDKRTAGVLEPADPSDTTLRRYLQPASRWTSVTPVVLPGHDDPAHLRRKADRERDSAERRQRLLVRVLARTEALIRKALRHSRIPEVLAMNARIEWGMTAFVPGVEAASRYGVPDHLGRFPRLHVRIDFRDEAGNPVSIPGPLCIGAGRFYGLGLLAAADGF